MICRKVFIFILLAGLLFPFSSKTLAQDSCKDTLSITDLKKKLLKVQKIRDEAEKGIIESDSILMKAQEIILLARARGNVKAAQIAEEAARSAEKSKDEHKKNKAQAETQIAYLNAIINEMEKKNFNTLAELCEAKKLKYEQVRNHLMSYVKEAEITVQEFEKIQKEAEEAKKEALELSISSIIENDLLKDIVMGRTYKKLKDLIVNSKTLNHTEKVKLYNTLEKIKKEYERLPILVAIKTGSWTAETVKEIKDYLSSLNQDLTIMANARKALEERPKSDETLNLLYDLLGEYAEESKKITEVTKRILKHLDVIKMEIETARLYIKLDYLEGEIGRLYKVTDPERTNFWIEEHKKAFEDYKKCKELLQNCYKRE